MVDEHHFFWRAREKRATYWYAYQIALLSQISSIVNSIQWWWKAFIKTKWWVTKLKNKSWPAWLFFAFVLAFPPNFPLLSTIHIYSTCYFSEPITEYNGTGTGKDKTDKLWLIPPLEYRLFGILWIYVASHISLLKRCTKLSERDLLGSGYEKEHATF